MLEVHTAGSWLVLGKFLARSRQNLGKISATSRRNFGSSGDQGLRGDPKQPQGSPKEAKECQKAAKGRPKAAKGSQKRGQREPKGAKREAKGSQRKPKGRPKGAQGGLTRTEKSIKNDKKLKLFLHSVLGAIKEPPRFTFWLIFEQFWEPTSLIFRVIFWLSFLIDF